MAMFGKYGTVRQCETESTDGDERKAYGELTHAKSVLKSVFNTVLMVLAACGIVAMLPERVFMGHKLLTLMEESVTVMLLLGVVSQLFKWTMNKRRRRRRRHASGRSSNQEWENLILGARVMSGFAVLFSAVVLVLSFLVEAPGSAVCYWGLVTAMSAVTCLTADCALSAYDEKRDGQRKRLLFLMADRFQLFLFLAVYIHINLSEASVTLHLYGVADYDNVTTSHHNHHTHSNGTDARYEHLYEIWRSADFAVVAELMVLLLVCHRFSDRSADERPVMLVWQTADDDNEHWLLGSRSSQVVAGSAAQQQTTTMSVGWYCSTGLVFVVGGLGSTAVLTALIAITMAIGLRSNIMLVLTLKMCFHLILGVYLFCVLVMTGSLHSKRDDISRRCFGRWFPPTTEARRRSISGSLDLVLLRFSMYCLLFLLCLLMIANASGDVSPAARSPISYLYLTFNAANGWLQYAVLFHFTDLYYALEECQNEQDRHRVHREMRLYMVPVAAANALLWMYNLWQWKSVTLLVLPDGATPGAVWAVMESFSFPPTLFFRFHSAFLCCTLWPAPKCHSSD